VDFDLTPEQQALVASAGHLAWKEFGPTSRTHDVPGPTVRNCLPVLARSGFAGLALPEDVGGQGAGLLEAVLVIETVARINAVAGDAVQALNFGAVQQLAQLGSAGLKARYLAPCLEGKQLTAISMTEPEAGSGVSGLSTTVRHHGGNVVLDGAKIFTTHGADADFFVVWARFGSGRDEVGAVVVERGAPGLSVDASNTFLSGEPYGMLFFDQCTVPAANVLVDRDGLRAMFPVFNIERLGNAARSLAAGQAAFDLALAHVGQRRQFGKLLSDFQGLRWRLAETGLLLESARLLLYRAAVGAGSGLPAAGDTAMAKLACNRAGFAAADAAVQLLGGQGFDAESVAGYLFHRTRGWMIAGGTVEQMLNRIASGLVNGTTIPGQQTRILQGAAR
jgi:alkylation response protein AidB-like acyl-CoA dehydrogenase